ncbi:MAG: AMP-binding protein [Pseudomonadota bacterium]|nr:AMP-binding protein [Pseudomonadota bacterium]
MRLEIILAAHAESKPGKTAIICDSQAVTYGSLHASVAQMASALAARGIAQGDVVVFYLPSGIEFVQMLYAVYTLGAVAVPVTTRLSESELTYICKDSTPKVLVFDAAESGKIRGLLAQLSDRVLISVGGDVPGAANFSVLLKTPARPLPRLSTVKDDCMIMYTSGTTGKPKGAIVTHANIIIQHCYLNAVDWGISGKDRYLVVTPLTHRTGFARLSNSLCLGGTIVVLGKFDPELALEAIEKEKITVFGMVPTIARIMLPYIEENPTRCASLQRITATGEAFPVSLKKRLIAALPDLKLYTFFAQTEAGGLTSLSHEEQFTHPKSVGRPSPGVEVRIVDDEGTEVAAGVVGELTVRVGEPGRYIVMRGYYNRPEETAEVFKEGWLHTGDLGYLDDDGYLYIADRKKDMIISGGFNIFSKEVEQVITAMPSVADAAVVGVADEKYGEAITAFVVLEVPAVPGSAPDADAIILHCKSEIASYKKPKYVFLVDDLPRNSLGKVLKGKLRKQAALMTDT